jgi:hypothetical protein
MAQRSSSRRVKDLGSALTELLHDAQLESVAWNARHARLALRLRCLRAHPSGRRIQDPTVELTLPGVRAVAIAWDDARIETRPSRYRRQRRIRERDLVRWPYAPVDVDLEVGRGNATLEALTSGVVDWIRGDTRTLEAPFLACFEFGAPRELGPPVDRVRLLVASDAPLATTRGRPLARQIWWAEFEAWWARWRKHWGGERRRASTRTVAPVVRSAPAFEIGHARLPIPLAEPVRAWFESETRARDLAGRAHARGITHHWREGLRGCVVVAGFERLPAEEELPAEDRACTWAIALRRDTRRAPWRVTSWSQTH